MATIAYVLLGAVLLTNFEKMKKWEYKWDTIENYIAVIKHSELLSERSSEGWELVSVVMIKVGSDDRMRFYWKRELI